MAIGLSLAGCFRLEDANDENNREVSGENGGVGDENDRNGDDGGQTTADESENGSTDGERSEGEANSEAGDEVAYPTGLSEDGVSPVLVSSTRRGLESRTGTIEFLKHHVSDDVMAENFEAKVGQDVAVVDRSGRSPGDIFLRPAKRIWRTTYDGRRLYGSNPVPYMHQMYLKTEFLQSVLAMAEFDTPERVSEDGEPRFRTESIGIDDSGVDSDAIRGDSVESVDATLLVDADGVVRNFEAEIVYRDEGTEKYTAVEMRITELGTTPITEPDWVETATERAPTFSVTVADDLSHVTYTHEGGDDVPSAASVGLYGHHSGEGGSTRLRTSFSEGESIHAWIQDGDVTVSRSESPTDTTPLDDHYTTLDAVNRLAFFKAGVEDL